METAYVILCNLDVVAVHVGSREMAEKIMNATKEREKLFRTLDGGFTEEQFEQHYLYGIQEILITRHSGSIASYWVRFSEYQIESALKAAGYKDLGWMNGWKSVHYDKDHNIVPKNSPEAKTFGYTEDDYPDYRSCDNLPKKEISYSQRGSKNLVICDARKMYWWYDCSD